MIAPSRSCFLTLSCFSGSTTALTSCAPFRLSSSHTHSAPFLLFLLSRLCRKLCKLPSRVAKHQISSSTRQGQLEPDVTLSPKHPV